MTLRTVFRLSSGLDADQIIHAVSRITQIPESEFHARTALTDIPDVQHRGDATYATDYGRGWDTRVAVTYTTASNPHPGISLTGTQAPHGAVEITFDTTYGYHGAAGNCNRLHATYITALAHFCQQHGASWAWQNEYTGRWHTDTTRSIQRLISI